MDIDKMFKVPNLPSKRKMSDNPSPEMLKKLKVDAPAMPRSEDVNTPAKSQSDDKGKRRAVTVEDEEDVEMEDDSFAPGNDADYFAEEDDEGRFFGGGLTSEQKEIMNIFDKSTGEGVQDDADELSITSIRRLLTRFERAVNKNQDQRSKYPDDPTKFIDSEADLDSALKSLLPLAQAPVLAYAELVKSGAISLLIGLLSHENVDIVIDVVEVVHELTDEDVGEVDDGDDEDEERTAEGALKVLIEALLENSILELLVDNLARFNETEESDRQGVFHVLGIFENILGFNPQLSTKLVSSTSILPWLLTRLQAKKHDENRGYAAELLSILLQDNQSNRLELGKKDGVETFLKVLSQFRKRDPHDADETEFMENVFDALCSALNERQIKEQFVAAEGCDLMVLIMKEKLQACSLAIKTLDYSMSGPDGSAACDAFIEALGLKTLFSSFMGKTHKKSKSTTPASSEDTSHILGILASLFTNIDSESTGRIRLLAKFVEGNYEKVDKLLEIRDSARSRLNATEADIEREKKEMLEAGDEFTAEEEVLWDLRRLEGGQFTLQNVDYILAWVVMEDDGVRAHVMQMLDRRNRTVKDIAQTLRVYYDNVGDGTEADTNEEQVLSQKQILGNLIAVLEEM